jgi:bacterioferritin
MRTEMSFVKDIDAIRSRARQKLEQGAVTQNYALNPDHSVNALNEALATEIVCVLRYRFHYIMATGIHSAAVADEFLEHAQSEQEHASRIAKRIKELGGKPEMNPAQIAQASHTEFKEGVGYFGDKDPTSRRMLEEILADEEQHADDLADLLFAMSPENVAETRRLYFKDEAPSGSDGGESKRKTAH